MRRDQDRWFGSFVPRGWWPWLFAAALAFAVLVAFVIAVTG